MSQANIAMKAELVAGIKEMLEKSSGVILYDYRGLTVSEVTALRNEFRSAGVVYKVLKNTMVQRAVDEIPGLEGLKPYLEGPTAIAFGYEDPVAPAKILSEFIKKIKKSEIKAGVVEGQVIDAEGVKALANLPSREVLLAKMLGSMNAPITGFVSVLSGTLRSLVCALNAVKEKKEA
ncbi:MAG: 50S ribosomal protein L10 [Christensenellales bacterium]|jgi:large subunit ribosomal protein L10